MSLEELGRDDKRHLDAADGWLHLGNWREANEELENITARLRAHPQVLRIRYGVYGAAKLWAEAAEIAHAIAQLEPESSFGWIFQAHALHRHGQTEKAWKALLPAARRFPREHLIKYKLACYACQLGELKTSLRWLTKAIDGAGKKDIRMLALEDPDLEPLWARIGEI